MVSSTRHAACSRTLTVDSLLSSLRPIPILALILVAACGGDQLSADASKDPDSTAADSEPKHVISLDERVSDSAIPPDSALEAGASTRLLGIEARLWDSRSGTFQTIGDSVHISDDAQSGALLVVVGGQAPGGTIPATIELEVTDAEGTLFNSGFMPSFQVGDDGTFRTPFLVNGELCMPVKLVARTDGGRELTRKMVFTCGPLRSSRPTTG